MTRYVNQTQRQTSLRRARMGGPSSSLVASAGNARTEDHLTNGNRRRKRHHRGGTASSGVAVWGYTPHDGSTQAGMTRLFSEQKRLTAALLRQSKLAKLAVEEVRSTEQEHLRRVNQAILDPLSGLQGFSNPFAQRRLIDAQRISEDMIARQGTKVIGSELPPRTKNPPPPPPTIRRRGGRPSFKAPTDKIRRLKTRAHLEDLLDLRGPLAREYARSVRRGYQGPPARWLKGPKAVRHVERLLRKGFTFPPPDKWSIFDPLSPLHWAVNSSSGFAGQSPSHGFRGERLTREPSQRLTFPRQAAAVQRLRLSDWPSTPRGGRSWPTFPTLNESWEMMMRKKLPHHHYDIRTPQRLRSEKIPTKRVLPGSSVRAVSELVLGIRAWVEVPKEFLAYFKYRWGFLILYRRAHLPKELVKFLARRWKMDISEMFLKCPIRYNDALRRIPPTTYYVMVGFTPSQGGPKTPVTRGPRKRAGRSERRVTKLETLRREFIPDGYNSPSPSDKSGDGVRLN